MLTVEELKTFFKRDRFVDNLGVEIIELTPEKAVTKVAVHEGMFNATGTVQGGMLYTLADFTFATLANYLHPITVTQTGNISYVRPAKTAWLTATAKETLRAKHTCISEVVIQDADGEIVCVSHFNGFVKDVAKEDVK